MSSSSRSIIEPPAAAVRHGWVSAHMRVLCPEHGLVDGRLTRGAHRFGNLVVPDALAYECPSCGRTCAFPPQSTGRVFLAEFQQQEWKVTEFRVPRELHDLALNVHAHFRSSPAGDIYSLPLHLGLRLVADFDEVAAEWRVVDDFPYTERARPRLSEATLGRLDGLTEIWGGASRSDVFRWVIVAAARATQVGIPSFVEQSRSLVSFDITSTEFLAVEAAAMRSARVETQWPDVEDFSAPPMVLQ